MVAHPLVVRPLLERILSVRPSCSVIDAFARRSISPKGKHKKCCAIVVGLENTKKS